MSLRTEKVANLIRQEVSQILLNQFGDLSPNMITVTHVKMSVDLSVAKVYLSIWGQIEDVDMTFLRLEEHKKEIRFELSKVLRNHFRSMPELIFIKDDSLEYAQKLESIFKKIHEEDHNRGSASGAGE